MVSPSRRRHLVERRGCQTFTNAVQLLLLAWAGVTVPEDDMVMDERCDAGEGDEE